MLVCLAGAGLARWYTVGRDKMAPDSQAARPGPAKPARPIPVDVVTPRAGGIDRVCVQPGTVEPFAAADLFAKVSGYLTEQTVDIGSPVREGQVLARISVPEYQKQVDQDAADVARADAKVEQMTAAVASAEADAATATAGVALAQAEIKSKASFRAYREKQRNRIRDLASQETIARQLMDEQEDQFQAATSAELAATEAVQVARQKASAAEIRVKQTHADLKYARAEVVVAKAKLEKAQVLLDYTVIKSPYTGVVTKRNFFPGDFIRSADVGGERVPLLAVERTDVMRVVVQVPDRDVPFVDVGDPATVQVDALPGTSFKTAGADGVVISRYAASEDAQTRMMRVEVDLKNPDGTLRRGMYGRVNLLLHPGEPNAVRIPASALVGKAEGGKATVRIVRDDVVQVVPVRYGTDTGAEVEVLTGLSPADRVVVRAGGPVDNGTQVTPTVKADH